MFWTAKRIQKLLDAENLSKEELATRLSVSRQTVYNWLKDGVKSASHERIIDLTFFKGKRPEEY